MQVVVEVRVTAGTPFDKKKLLLERLKSFMQDKTVLLEHDYSAWMEDQELRVGLEQVYVGSDEKLSARFVNLGEVEELHYHCYQLYDECEQSELYTRYTLPNARLESLWSGLLYDGGENAELLALVNRMRLFSQSNLDTSLIAFNRLLLLTGPPGTGKTTLCKALSHELSIRDHRPSVLLCIHAHNLFSRWFSESGKLIDALFEEIMESAQGGHFVYVLVDEVESLTLARRAALQGNEPSDALRAVNALLTCLDRLQEVSNVLLLATSNLPEVLDDAFLDRVDVRLEIKNPSKKVRYTILQRAINELLRVGLVKGRTLPDYESIDLYGDEVAGILRALVERTSDLSGRSLKKAVLKAYSTDQSELIEKLKHLLD